MVLFGNYRVLHLCFEIFLAWQTSNQDGDVLIDLDELDSHGYDRFMSDMKRR